MYNYQIVGKLPELKCVEAKYYCKPMSMSEGQKIGILSIKKPDTILDGELNWAGSFSGGLHWLFQTSFSQN